MFKKKFLFVAFLLMLTTLINAQVTTSGMNGKIIADGESAIGATIQVVHVPSGTRYGTITNDDGRFSLQGMRTGGPYKVEISYVGFNKATFSGITLELGETYLLNATLKASSKLLDEVVVVGSREGAFNSQRMGSSANFSRRKIENTPTISRSVFDITKMIPQGVNTGSGMSFSGTSNKYNSFQIDGTVTNDVFGLSSSGTNGGQAGANPVSLDAIEEVQVVIAPFDVRQSGFTGGGVNAITKSGTNDFHASVYGFYNNQDFAGKTAGKDVENRKSLSQQSAKTFGFTLGGPIIKNKLFFFVNAEKVKETYPSSYNVGDGSLISEDIAKQIQNKTLALTGGYNAGGYGSVDVNTESTKLLARVDWNINQNNKFTLRYNFLDGNKLNFSNGDHALHFNDNGYTMVNKTHSLVAELNSRFNEKLSNELRMGFTSVRDHREIGGQAMPYIMIKNVATTDGKTGSVYLGSENYSMANSLDQDIYSLTDNLTLYTGNHSVTFGTSNEFFNMGNLFIRNMYGNYTYNSLQDFLNIGTPSEKVPYSYEYSYVNSDVVGGNKLWKPTFGAAQLGFYAQDEWNVTDLLRLTYGVRMDVPFFFDSPDKNPIFNGTSLSSKYGVEVGKMPSSAPLFSPRIGFRWSLDESRKTLLRGGVGIFTGRIPFVWISNNFSNTGMALKSTKLTKTSDFGADYKGFNINPDQQYVPSKVSTAEIDVSDKKFKYPQVFRANLALERTLPYGIRGTLEGLYSKTLNNIYYQNLVVEDAGKTINNGGDNRPYYTQTVDPNGKTYSSQYNGVYYLANTNKGYTYSLTAKLEKDFDFGLSTMAAYTFGHSKGLNDGTSSQANSNWGYNEAVSSNHPSLTYSDFDVPHRVIASISYKKEYAKMFATSVSLFYQGQSGSRYSMVYDGDINNDTNYGNDVIYVPTDAELANMKFLQDNVYTKTSDEQRAAFGQWINNNKDISKRKGSYIERNSLISAFENHFDLHIAQDFYFNVGGKKNTLQIAYDILNVGNLLNSAWGLYNYVSYSYKPIAVKSVAADGTPTFQFKAGSEPSGISDYNSRWRSQISVRYSF
jgi:hypothetical protein